jgi:transcriptional regulator with XRE-family HTH domain
VSEDVTPEICAQIVRLLTEERKRLGLSQNALAAKAGVNQSLVSALEKEPWNPTISTLLRLAFALRVDLGVIVTKAQRELGVETGRGRKKGSDRQS